MCDLYKARVAWMTQRRNALMKAMTETDSDMFDYFAGLEVDRIDAVRAKYLTEIPDVRPLS